MTTRPNLNIVPFVSVDNMMRLVLHLGVERVLTELAAEIARFPPLAALRQDPAHRIALRGGRDRADADL